MFVKFYNMVQIKLGNFTKRLRSDGGKECDDHSILSLNDLGASVADPETYQYSGDFDFIIILVFCRSMLLIWMLWVCLQIHNLHF